MSVKLTDLTVVQARAAVGALETLVDRTLPLRFYPSSPASDWERHAAALIARMTDLACSTCDVALTGRSTDAVVLLRVLYEHVVTSAWLAAEPEARMAWWREDAARHVVALRREAEQYGLPPLEGDVAPDAPSRGRFPTVLDRARAADAHWGGKVPGLRTHNSATPGVNLLTFTGLYTAIYRVASGSVHAQSDSLKVALVEKGNDIVEARRERAGDPVLVCVSPNLLAMALAVHSHQFSWPGGDEVRAVIDRYVAGGFRDQEA